MAALKICMLGGTGFVGRAIAARLSNAGHRVRIPTRAPATHRDITVLPGVTLVAGNVHDPGLLRAQFDGIDAVINLVGTLHDSRRAGAGFEQVHVELPGKVAAACRAAGVRRLLHMSALGAAADAPSAYLRTKAAGEAAAHAAGPDVRVTSFRPSTIFGPRDSFINRFAGLLELAPGVFPLACADARFQPVYVEDVARAYVASLAAYRTYGGRYELCGPKTYRLREIVGYIARLQGRQVRIVALGDRLSRLQAAMLEYVPGKPFTRDNYLSLTIDSVCGGASALAEIFGIAPTPLERVVPGYIAPRVRS